MHLLSIYCVAALTEVGRSDEEIGTTVPTFCRVAHRGMESKAPCVGYE